MTDAMYAAEAEIVAEICEAFEEEDGMRRGGAKEEAARARNAVEDSDDDSDCDGSDDDSDGEGGDDNEANGEAGEGGPSSARPRARGTEAARAAKHLEAVHDDVWAERPQHPLRQIPEQDPRQHQYL